jgi:citrate synthase
LEALQVPRDAFTGIFASARVIGWVAHALEQAEEARLIRPQSRYIGPSP